MKTYENFEIDNINESFNFTSWKNELKKVKKDLNVNFFFISTFGMGITVFFPIIQNLIDNSNIQLELAKSDVIMLTICAISILANENKEAIDKIKEKLKEKKLLDILQDVLKSIKSIKNILFKAFEKLTGIVFKDGGILDLLGYTSLFVPSLEILMNIINQEGMSLSKMIGIGLAYGTGIGIFTLKSFVNRLLKKMKKSPEINEALLIIEKSRPGSMLKKEEWNKIVLTDSENNTITLNYPEWIILEKIYINKSTTISKLSKKSRLKVGEIIEAISKLLKKNLILKEKGSGVVRFNEDLDPVLIENIENIKTKFL